MTKPRLLSLAVLAAIIFAPQAAFAFQDRADVKEQARVDDAVVRALRFLSDEQDLEGSWKAGTYGDSTATTSLAVMAFMAAGHVPGEGPYGNQINRGIRWVLAQQQPNGMLVGKGRSHGPMYSHGISSLMLAEVFGMIGEEGLSSQVKRGLEDAIRLILKAQEHRKEPNHRGGWRYSPNSHDSDLSVTAWQLLALRAAKDAGCDVPAENIDDAILYVRRLRVPGNRGFGYQAGHGSTATRAGTGILALEVCGDHHSEEVLGAADQLLRRPLNRNDGYFFYGAYYCTVGMFKVGGPRWERIKPVLYDSILGSQLANGSWHARNGSERKAGPNYATSMAVLALAVEYRFLPIYQR